VAERVKAELQQRLDSSKLVFKGRAFASRQVSTAVLQATTFYAAHDEHQQYLEKNPGGYCNHGIRLVWADQPAL
jgi:peptide-methionine (S)-S-oxide reductase